MVRINLSIIRNGSSDLINFGITSLGGESIKDFQIPYSTLTPFGVRIDLNGELIFPKLPGGKYYAELSAFKEGLKVLSENNNGEYSFYYSPINNKTYSK